MKFAVIVENETQSGFACFPFEDEDEAKAFAAFLTAEVEPAAVVPMSSPTKELLSWYESKSKEPKPW